jgi:hypothetical protein
LHLPESEPHWRAGRGFVVRDWRSGVSAERRHLKISGQVCGGLPTRRYEAGESFVVPLKIHVPAVNPIILQAQPQSHRRPDGEGNSGRTNCEETGVNRWHYFGFVFPLAEA